MTINIFIFTQYILYIMYIIYTQYIIYNTRLYNYIHTLCKFTSLYMCIYSVHSWIYVQNVILQNFNYVNQ